MDTNLFIFLVILYAFVYLILAQAKDRDGKKYGFAKMARMWFYALPYLTSSLIEWTIKSANGNPETIKITYSQFFLIIMPFAMIFDNLIRKKKTPNQAPEPTTMAVTPPAAQESRQPRSRLI